MRFACVGTHLCYIGKGLLGPVSLAERYRAVQARVGAGERPREGAQHKFSNCTAAHVLWRACRSIATGGLFAAAGRPTAAAAGHSYAEQPWTSTQMATALCTAQSTGGRVRRCSCIVLPARRPICTCASLTMHTAASLYCPTLLPPLPLAPVCHACCNTLTVLLPVLLPTFHLTPPSASVCHTCCACSAELCPSCHPPRSRPPCRRPLPQSATPAAPAPPFPPYPSSHPPYTCPLPLAQSATPAAPTTG